jgi:isopenicillin N synthase-like dioxygenase
MWTTNGKKPLPILDISLFYSNQSLFVERLRHACHNVGFFLLRHDIESSLIKEQLVRSREFFSLPLREKLSISYENSPSFRGYMELGAENTAGQTDYREQVEFAVEYGDPASTTAWPPFERLKGRNPWPNLALEEVCTRYAKEICRTADCIRQGLCLALQLDKDYLSPEFMKPDEPPHWVLKLISYPPRLSNDQGVGAHTDTNFLTLVLQDEVGGLQAFSSGEWIDVPSDLGDEFLVCNLGEQAEIFSRGYFLATPHRVTVNRSGRTRTSAALFYNPALSTKIEPIHGIPNAVPRERSMEYELEKHWRRRSNTMLASVGENTFKSLARSHALVFAKNHPDLMLSEDGRVLKKTQNESNEPNVEPKFIATCKE